MCAKTRYENRKIETTPQRSKLMSRIKAKNTLPEIILRKSLWKLNIRYRIHAKHVPGSPDIMIEKYKLVIFIDGGFWHGFDWQKKKNDIRSNSDFWIAKIERNISRDHEINNKLSDLRYIVMRFWDHDIHNKLDKCINQITLYLELFKK